MPTFRNTASGERKIDMIIRSSLFSMLGHFFLKKFNFGKPDILKMSLVLKLNILKSINGSEVIKCAIKISGLFFFNKKNSGTTDNNIINKYENLLYKNPFFGRNL